MRHLWRNAIFTVALLMIAGLSIFPPADKLRLGKDLRGGVTQVYSVRVNPGEDAQDVLAKTIETLERRIDPTGLLELNIVARGTDTIEVTMPLPNESTRALRDAYEAELEGLGATRLDASEVDEAMPRIAGLETAEARTAALLELAPGDVELARLEEALRAYRDYETILSRYRAERDRVESLGAEAGEAEETALVALEDTLVAAELAYLSARDAAVVEGVEPALVRSALRLPNEPELLRNETLDEAIELPSPRQRELDRLREAFPSQADEIEAVVASYRAYESQRTGLDDPDELQRLIAAAGVPAFRITVAPGALGVQEARSEFRESGPLNAAPAGMRWCEINDITNWYDSVQQLEALEAEPVGFFAGRGYVVEPWNATYWMLCWDTRQDRLTQRDGTWSVASAYRSRDQLGRPAIGFTMDARGARLLGRLTAANVDEPMAVLLDEQVYTAPTLNDAISQRGIITGRFTPDEIDYVIQVLQAGSLSARVDPDPVSVNEIAPEFGQDNLETGRAAGIVALTVVSGFMVAYYFFFGLVAVTSLVCNALLILGAMALARAAFSLPGIAGIILTFGMAVDANVLIYERIREEMRKGEELRVAVRLGYQKAMSAIVDGNVTNLIVCFILGTLGTQEIKGFAITLGIGVVATLFSALVISRLLLSIAVDRLKMRRLGMLPTAVPVVERLLEPKIDWMAARWVFVVISAGAVSLGIGMSVYQGEEMFDTEFRGGTAVTMTFREAGEGDAAVSREGRVTLERSEVIERLRGLADAEDEALRPVANAGVSVVDPEADLVSSDTFTIETYVPQQDLVLSAVSSLFSAELATSAALTFDGRGDAFERALGEHVFRVLSGDLGEVIGRPDVRADVSEELGGVVVVLDGLGVTGSAGEAVTAEDIGLRLADARRGADFSATLSRTARVVVLEGTSSDVRSAAVVVSDPAIGLAAGGDERWRDELAAVEWRLAQEALGRATTFASVQSFSPLIAAQFAQTAVVAVGLSFLLILIYIWVRFGSVRYSFAAIMTLIHDVLFAIGLIALAEILDKTPATQAFARQLGIEPFKIDLTLIAAILTIIGYSLNDTIIIMDRIRENRGRLPYASRRVINDSINQTISRTVITSGTTLLATLILYTSGGDGVHAFAYALLVGVLVGTYSSVAVAAPLVWSSRRDPHAGRGVTPAGPATPRLD